LPGKRVADADLYTMILIRSYTSSTNLHITLQICRSLLLSLLLSIT